MKLPFRRRSRQAEYFGALLQQVEELRDENARLRMDATRPASLQDARTRFAEIAGRYKTVELGAIHGSQQDRLDKAWHLMAEAQQVRSSLMSVLADLALACGQLSRQMAIDGGPMEIDRRVSERRGPAAELAAGAGGRPRVEEAVGQSLESFAGVAPPTRGLGTPDQEVEETVAIPSLHRPDSRRRDDRRAGSHGHQVENENPEGHGNDKVEHAQIAESAIGA